MKTLATLNLLGFASGIAGNNPDCALGPWYLYYHPELLATLALRVKWLPMVKATSADNGLTILPLVEQNLTELAQAVLPLATRKERFCVIGGDHSSAIGTWSAVAHANRQQGDIGLIWVDAHMDSHTPETSETQNIHGMPIAHLLGYGVNYLCDLFDAAAKIKPQNLCLIGIRSYQAPEAHLLARLGVKVYFMAEVQARGIDVVFAEAQAYVLRHTCGFGLSIDLDGFDPEDAPGVGYHEPGGIDAQAFIQSVHTHLNQAALLGLEITEYNPLLDVQAKTAHLIAALLDAVYA